MTSRFCSALETVPSRMSLSFSGSPAKYIWVVRIGLSATTLKWMCGVRAMPPGIG